MLAWIKGRQGTKWLQWLHLSSWNQDNTLKPLAKLVMMLFLIMLKKLSRLFLPCNSSSEKCYQHWMESDSVRLHRAFHTQHMHGAAFGCPQPAQDSMFWRTNYVRSCSFSTWQIAMLCLEPPTEPQLCMRRSDFENLLIRNGTFQTCW